MKYKEKQILNKRNVCDLEKELTLGLGLGFSGFPCQ